MARWSALVLLGACQGRVEAEVPLELDVVELAKLGAEACPAVCVCAGKDCPEPPAGVDCDPCFFDEEHEWPKGPFLLTPIAHLPGGAPDVPRPKPKEDDEAAVCHEMKNLTECLACCVGCTSDAVGCQDGCTYDPTDPTGPLLFPGIDDLAGCVTDPECWIESIEGWLGEADGSNLDPCGESEA